MISTFFNPSFLLVVTFIKTSLSVIDVFITYPSESGRGSGYWMISSFVVITARYSLAGSGFKKKVPSPNSKVLKSVTLFPSVSSIMPTTGFADNSASLIFTATLLLIPLILFENNYTSRCYILCCVSKVILFLFF